MKRLFAGAAATLIVAATLAAGVVSPAAAADIPGPIGNAYDLMNYPLSVKSSELFASQTEAAKAAWTPQLGRTAASQAGGYAASGAYGNLSFGPETPGYKSGVVPIDTSTPLKPPRRPAFPASKFLRSPLGGVIGATVAVTAFDMRGDISDGVLGWVGIDANGNVCSDPVFGGNNPLNWLTGQDCSQWGKPSGYVANDGLVPHPAGYLSATYAGNLSGKDWQCSFAPVTLIGTTGVTIRCDVVVMNFTGSTVVQPQALVGCRTSSGSYRVVSGGTRDIKVGVSSVSWTVNCNVGEVLSFVSGSIGCVTPHDPWSQYSLGVTTTCAGPGYANVHRPTAPSVETDQVLYFSPSSPDYVDLSNPDPDYTIQCTLTMTDSSTVSGTTAAFKDTGDAWPAPVCGTVPDGKVTAHKTVALVGGGEVRTLQDDDTTDAYLAAAAADPSLCTGVGKACILDLIDLATGVTCFKEGETCDGWLQDPDRDTKYACFYGGQATVVNDCYVYATTFNAAKRLAGDGYADPHTGEDVGAAGPTSKSADEELMGKGFGTVVGPFSWSSCFGGTYAAFNPIEWALKPMQCALKWAFVPRPEVVQADVQALSEQWSSTAPVKVFAAVSSWHINPSASGCAGPPIDIHFPIFGGSTFDYTGNPLSACAGSRLAPIAATARAATTVFALIGGAYAILNLLGGAIGFRVGGGGDDR
jgi:hypothetical protein